MCVCVCAPPNRVGLSLPSTHCFVHFYLWFYHHRQRNDKKPVFSPLLYVSGSILLPNTPTYSTTASHRFCSLIPWTAPTPIATDTATTFVQIFSCIGTEISLLVSLCFSFNLFWSIFSSLASIYCATHWNPGSARLNASWQGPHNLVSA